MKLWLIPFVGFALIWSAATLHKERRTITPAPVNIAPLCGNVHDVREFRAIDAETGQGIDVTVRSPSARWTCVTA